MMLGFLSSFRRIAYQYDAFVHGVLYILGISLGALLLFLYVQHPFLLSQEIPFAYEDVMPFFREYLRPELLEGHLYHVGVTLFLIISFLTWAGGCLLLHGCAEKKRRNMLFTCIGASCAIFLSLIFLVFRAWNAVTTEELFRYIIFGIHPIILIILSIFLLGWIFGKLPACSRFIEIIVILAFLLLVFWDPLIRISLLGGAGYHVWFFLAPVHDLLQGKHLLVDTSSQYGVLLIQMLAGVFRLGMPFTFASFSLFLVILSLLYHGALFCLLRITYRDRFLALVGLLLIVSMGFLRHAQFNFPGEPYVHPSALKLRFLFDVPILALLTLHAQKRKDIFLFSAMTLFGIVILYNFEIGLSLLFAIIAYVITDAWRMHEQWRNTFMRVFLPLAVLLMSVATALGVFILWTFAASNSLPDFSSLFLYPRLYYSGFGSLPMPIVGAWVLFVFIYVCTLFLCGRRLVLGEEDSLLALRAGWAVYGLMIFHYYVSHSSIVNLSAVTVPAIVLGIWFLKDLRIWLRHSFSPIYRSSSFVVAGVFLFVVICVLSLELTAGYSSARNLFIKRYATPLFLAQEDAYRKDHPTDQTWGFPLPAKEYVQTAHAVREFVPAPQRPLILSQQDFLHFWILDSTNALRLPYQRTLALNSEVQDIERQIMEKSSRYLFMDAPDAFIDDVPPCALCEQLKPFIEEQYVFRWNIGLLDVYERRSSFLPS